MKRKSIGLLCTSIVAFAGAGQAQVNVGNLEVAKHCFETSSLLQNLSGNSVPSGFYAANKGTFFRDSASELIQKLSFFTFIAEGETSNFLQDNWNQLTSAVEVEASCRVQGDRCFEGSLDLFSSFAAELQAACRSDYLGAN